MNKQLQQKLKTLPRSPGVYFHKSASGEIIYIGKAAVLKNRVRQYFQSSKDFDAKTRALVAEIYDTDWIETESEIDALFLESEMIKRYMPRYNILLRDDKSYPYILLTKERHPRITAYRGSKKIQGEYFGPYPHAGAVRDTLSLLQKLFPIRQCENSVYKNRSRPCLQHQIGRCSAPCVAGYVSDEEYNQQVEFARLFLQGKDNQVLEHLIQKMEQASRELNFEQAAHLRDQIQMVRSVTEKQFVSNERLDDMDIISIAYQLGIACVQVLFIRQGKVLGNRSYFPKVPINTDLSELTETFVGQFYLQAHQGRTIPNSIIVDHKLDEKKDLETLLSEQAGRKVSIQDNAKGSKSKYLQLAQVNAKAALITQLKQASLMLERYEALQTLLGIEKIERMECFDISHTMGAQTIASCVVFNRDGPLKSDYRRFNIEGITGGDDYAAMEQALKKRFDRDLESEKIPDIIFIDGGKGQLNRALQVFQELDVKWDKNRPHLIGVAKGVDRKAGLETLIISRQEREINLSPDNLALHLIQHIRDESHNHAISGHRKKRQKAFTQSGLETIEGVGAKRRQALLKYLGGMQGVKNATLDEIASVPGISKALAEKIFEALKN